MNEVNQPYVEEGSLRFFSSTVDDAEFEWHVDFEDRLITILKSNNWKLQLDETIPQKLIVGQEIFIEKFTWHRIIKGEGDLVVKIIKLS